MNIIQREYETLRDQRVRLRKAIEHYQMRATLERSPILASLFQEGRIGLVGGIYSVESGEVRFFEQHFNDSKEQTSTERAAELS